MQLTKFKSVVFALYRHTCCVLRALINSIQILPKEEDRMGLQPLRAFQEELYPKLAIECMHRRFGR